MQQLIDAARLGLEYADEVLAERKRALAGHPHGWTQEQRDVESIRAALDAVQEQEDLSCPTCGAEDGGTSCGLPHCGLSGSSLPPQSAAVPDPTDPGYDVDTLREHVRHLERRVRQLTPPQPVAVPDGTRALIEQCRAALAEELAAWDIDPPLHHVKQAHDWCVAWLAAALAAPAPVQQPVVVPDGWQPIETAPRDGTTVLLAAPGRVTAGEWHPEQWPTASEHHSSTGEYLGQYETGECIPAAWYSWDGGFTDDAPPTHWMQLPAAPGEAPAALATVQQGGGNLPPPLSDEQIVAAIEAAGHDLAYRSYEHDIEAARAVEAAHGITGSKS